MIVDQYVTATAGDAGVGSTDDGKFYAWSDNSTANSIGDRRDVFFSRAIQIHECWWVVSTAFAAASVNTQRVATSTTPGGATAPSDTIIVTLTANATGLFTNTGLTLIAPATFVTCLFNSDDGTDPAEVNAHGFRYTT